MMGTSSAFGEFWNAYPRRAGANPKVPARTKFDKAIRDGANAADIIAGARAYAGDRTTKAGTEFVAMAATWLNQRRWEDYLEAAATPLAPTFQNPIHAHPCGSGTAFWLMADTAEWVAWRITTGKSYPIDRFGGWLFPSRWPPGFEGSRAET